MRHNCIHFTGARNRYASKLIQAEKRLVQFFKLNHTIRAFSLNQWEQKLENSEINVTTLWIYFQGSVNRMLYAKPHSLGNITEEQYEICTFVISTWILN